ncbi:MAG: histidinol dehydrogenase, partial [Lysobacteraceae bacterium]
MIFIKAPEHDTTAGSLAVETTVRSVIAAVRERGDAAVSEFSQRFDGTSPDVLEVSMAEREAAVQALDPQTRADTEFAIENVRAFAEAQLATMLPLEVEPLPGLHLGHRVI